MSRTWRILLVALVLAFGAELTACGSDSDSDSSGDSGTETSQPANGIEGVTWSLMNIAIQSSATSLPAGAEVPTLEFEDGEVQVFTGCNSGSGPAEITDDTIEFGPVALTKKGCDQLATQIEQYVSSVTEGDVKYEISQGNLVLKGKNQISLIYTQK